MSPMPRGADDYEDCPLVVHVVGRSMLRENVDLVGEYRKVGLHHGRPAYRKPGTRTVIRYWSVADRWLIDRDGLQESDMCNAYAEQGGARHPAVEELVWRVWESSHRCHVRDPELLVTAVPMAIQIVGRASGKESTSSLASTKAEWHMSRRKEVTRSAIGQWET